MSHLQILLDEIAWREQLAQSAAAARETARQQRERAEIERQKTLRVCRCGMPHSAAHPVGCACIMQPLTSGAK